MIPALVYPGHNRYNCPLEFTTREKHMFREEQESLDISKEKLDELRGYL